MLENLEICHFVTFVLENHDPAHPGYTLKKTVHQKQSGFKYTQRLQKDYSTNFIKFKSDILQQRQIFIFMFLLNLYSLTIIGGKTAAPFMLQGRHLQSYN